MSKIVDYEIIKQINAGGMADIYLGLIYSDRGFQRLCAIKKLQPQYQGNARAEELFREEADIGQILQHTNIVRVIDFDKIGEADAIIMEFVNGTDALKLFQICKKVKMKISVGMAAYIGSELARALHYAHTAKDPVTGLPLGLVHCDVSPANVIISYEGEVKLTDFGVAKSNSQDEDLVAYSLKGKIRYMSPEYMHSGAADPRLDIYSLGVILWELLSGKELFKGATSDEVSKLKLESVSKMRLADDNDSVDPRLEEIIKKCLHYDPIKRYKSARELELELSQYFHLRDPGFTPMKLGIFLQSIRANEYRSMQELIRESLSKKHLPIKESASRPPQSLQSFFSETQDTVIVESPVHQRPEPPTSIPTHREVVAQQRPPRPPQIPPPQPQQLQQQQQRPQMVQTQQQYEDPMEFGNVTYHEPMYKSAVKHAPMDVDDWRPGSLFKRVFWLLFLTALVTGGYTVATSRSPKAEQIRKQINSVVNRFIR